MDSEDSDVEKANRDANKDVDHSTPHITKLSVSGKSSSTGRQIIAQSALVISKGHTVVDMSSQGLTMVAGSLFTRHNIGALDLSSNNIRQLPVDIRKLTNLSHLDISRNSIRCFHPHDFGGLPAALSQINALEVLLISECNLSFIPPAIWKLKKLRVLDISRNRINILVTDIGELEKLEHLNAEQTNIISLPAEIAFCQNLKELLLGGNAIECLPDTLKELKHLHFLTINYRSFCGIVDGYMEKLLRKGQIRSEFLPSVIFEMPALTCLDLEATKINSLPSQCVSLIVELYLANNFFQEIPQIVLNLSHLSILDLNENFITKIPSEIQRLRKLKRLYLDNNQITVFPVAIGSISELEILSFSNNLLTVLPNEISSLKKLKKLFLSKNRLISLPETFIDLSELSIIDITDNQISSLPSNFHLWPLRGCSVSCLHTYSKLDKDGLWLYGNPLVNPPKDIWITKSPERIHDYLRHSYNKEKAKVHNRSKLYVMGAQSNGKTSLCRSLGAGRASIIGESRDMAFGPTEYLDLRAWRTPSGLDYLVHDFSGDKTFHDVQHLFLDSKGLIILVYNSATYEHTEYDDLIGNYIERISICAPDSTIILVGTHGDLLDTDELKLKAETTARTILTTIQEQLKFKLNNINMLYTRICELSSHISSAKASSRGSASSRSIASSEYSSESSQASGILKRDNDSLKDQRQKLKRLRLRNIKLVDKILIMSSTDITDKGLENVIDTIQITAINDSFFSQNEKVIPESWATMNTALKKRYSHVFWVTWSEFTEVAGRIGVEGGQEGAAKCLRHLRDTGQVLWYEDNPKMAPIILHRPAIVICFVYSIFRSKDTPYFDFKENRVFKSKGGFVNETEFDIYYEKFKLLGEISRKLLRSLWFHLKISTDRFEALVQLTSRMDLWYAIPPPDLPVRGEQMPLLVVPSLNKDPFSRPERKLSYEKKAYVKDDEEDTEDEGWEEPEMVDGEEDFEFIDDLASDQREWALKVEFPNMEWSSRNKKSRDYTSTCCKYIMQRLACRLQPLAEYRYDWSDRIYVELICSTVVITIKSARQTEHQSREGNSLLTEEGSEVGDSEGGVLELRLRSEQAHRRSRDDFRDLVKTTSNICNSIPGLTYFMWKSN